MRGLLVIFALGCASGFTGKQINNPDTAHAFSCARSEPHPEYDECFVERQQCERYVVDERAAGAFVSECGESTRAFCFMGYERDAPIRVWRCAASHDTCDGYKEQALAARVLVDVGACIEKVVR